MWLLLRLENKCLLVPVHPGLRCQFQPPYHTPQPDGHPTAFRPLFCIFWGILTVIMILYFPTPTCHTPAKQRPATQAAVPEASLMPGFQNEGTCTKSKQTERGVDVALIILITYL